MKKFVFLLLLIIPLSCTHSEVLEEKVHDIGHGFKEVYQSIRMPKEHWEGVGHFKFIYYKEIELGQINTYQEPIGSDSIEK